MQISGLLWKSVDWFLYDNSLTGYFSGLLSKHESNLEPVRLLAIFSCKNKLAATKIQKQLSQVFFKRGFSIAKFLKTLILNDIRERLLLKISISLTNSEAVVQWSPRTKGVLRNFAKFTVKQLCQSLLFNKATDLRL